MKTVWLPRAIQDLETIRDYIKQENPQAASKVARAIINTVSLIEEHPYIGQASELDEIFEKEVAGLPYLIPYRVVEDRLEILRVFHEAQQRPKEWN